MRSGVRWREMTGNPEKSRVFVSWRGRSRCVFDRNYEKICRGRIFMWSEQEKGAWVLGNIEKSALSPLFGWLVRLWLNYTSSRSQRKELSRHNAALFVTVICIWQCAECGLKPHKIKVFWVFDRVTHALLMSRSGRGVMRYFCVEQFYKIGNKK